MSPCSTKRQGSELANFGGDDLCQFAPEMNRFVADEEMTIETNLNFHNFEASFSHPKNWGGE